MTLTRNLINSSFFNCGSDSSLFQYRIIAEKLNDELIKFGLTSNQINVFLFLSKYGESTASNISKSLTLPRTETYQILSTLQNRGIIHTRLCHPALFSALPLRDALSILINAEKTRISSLENSESELKKLWNKIPEFSSSRPDRTDNIQMLQGTNVIFAKLNELINSTKKNLKILCTDGDYTRFIKEGIFDKINSSKLEFLILTKSDKIILEHHYGKIHNIHPNKILQNQCFLIKDSSEVLFFIRNMQYSKGNIFAFSTTASSLIQTLELLFDNLHNKKSDSHMKLNAKKYGLTFTKIMSQFHDIEHEILPSYDVTHTAEILTS